MTIQPPSLDLHLPDGWLGFAYVLLFFAFIIAAMFLSARAGYKFKLGPGGIFFGPPSGEIPVTKLASQILRPPPGPNTKQLQLEAPPEPPGS